MKARTKNLNAESRLMDVTALQSYLSMGRSRSVEFAREAGAERRIGKRLLFDRQVIDKAIDNLQFGSVS